jgi:hypothetical protein
MTDLCKRLGIDYCLLFGNSGLHTICRTKERFSENIDSQEVSSASFILEKSAADECPLSSRYQGAVYIHALQKALGHTDLETTLKYAKYTMDSVRKSFQIFSGGRVENADLVPKAVPKFQAL